MNFTTVVTRCFSKMNSLPGWWWMSRRNDAHWDHAIEIWLAPCQWCLSISPIKTINHLMRRMRINPWILGLFEHTNPFGWNGWWMKPPARSHLNWHRKQPASHCWQVVFWVISPAGPWTIRPWWPGLFESEFLSQQHKFLILAMSGHRNSWDSVGYVSNYHQLYIFFDTSTQKLHAAASTVKFRSSRPN